MDTIREDLINIVHRHYKKHWMHDPVPYQLNSCQAWYSDLHYDEETGLTYRILQSYNTPVAVYIKDYDTVYRFGTWSNTTAQHQHKFTRKMGCKVLLDVQGYDLYRGWR